MKMSSANQLSLVIINRSNGTVWGVTLTDAQGYQTVSLVTYEGQPHSTSTGSPR